MKKRRQLKTKVSESVTIHNQSPESESISEMILEEGKLQLSEEVGKGEFSESLPVEILDDPMEDILQVAILYGRVVLRMDHLKKKKGGFRYGIQVGH